MNGWVNCPMCGAVGEAWESEDRMCFCGPCEQKYQEANAAWEELVREEDKRIKREYDWEE